MLSWQVEEVRFDDGYDLLLFQRPAECQKAFEDLSLRPSMLAS
jgi:hypothetical protein